MVCSNVIGLALYSLARESICRSLNSSKMKKYTNTYVHASNAKISNDSVRGGMPSNTSPAYASRHQNVEQVLNYVKWWKSLNHYFL